jgi:hypothetical protein
MAKLEDTILSAAGEDRQFVGTIAFRNEEITLPDGSSMALGIDGGHWVLVYQRGRGVSFTVYEYDSDKKTLRIDKKPGLDDDYKEMRKLIGYFFSHARTEDLITILPPRSGHD